MAPNYKCGEVSRKIMAVCPHCESDLTKWAERIEKAPAANTPKVWTCPECGSVLGVSDWGAE